MKLLKHVFTAFTIGFIIIISYLMYYTGYFKPVTLLTEEKGPYIYLFKEHSGPYHEAVKTLLEVESWAKNNNLKCQFSFGKYLDDPKKTEEGRLRSQVGCLLTEEERAALKTETLPEDFVVSQDEKTQYLVALFEGSPGIGPFKVYPKAFEYADMKKLTTSQVTTEIYEVLPENKMRTTYLWQVRSTEETPSLDSVSQ